MKSFLAFWLAVAAALCAPVGAPTLRAQQQDGSGDPHTSPASSSSLPPSPGAGHPLGAGTAGTGVTAQQAVALGGGTDLAQRARQGPIDIISDRGTTYENTADGRVATFTGSVNIITTDTSIYCDQATYNADTHDGILTGDVRIYRNDTTIMAERAIYNFNTKAIRALDFGGERGPYEFSSVGVFSPGEGLQYNLRNSHFTTDDSSQPDFHLNARRVRIYPDDRVIYVGATLYVGATPVFYFPYFYQSLDQQSGYRLTPGYSSTYGAYLLTGITFPVAEHITGLLRLDYRSSRGAAGGVTFEYKPNKKKKEPPTGNVTPFASDDDPGAAVVLPAPLPTPPNLNPALSPNNSPNALPGANGTASGEFAGGGYALTGEALSRQIRSSEAAILSLYGIKDDHPDLNRTSLDRQVIGGDRYRVKLTDYSFFTDDLFFKADLDKLSDRYLLQDFYEGEFTKNPNPDNVTSLAFYQPTFITTLSARFQANNFFDTTERLPDLSFDMPRTPLGKSGVFYQNENSGVYLDRTFDNTTILPSYSAYRLDTFHQFTDPQTLFGWLNLNPRLGLRATYYSSSAPESTAAYDLQYVNDTSDAVAYSISGANTPFNAATATTAQITAHQNLLALQQAIKQFQPGDGIFRPVVNVGMEGSFKLSHVYDDIESRAFGLDKIQHVIQPYADVSYIEDFGQGSRKLLQFDRLLPTTELSPIEFPQFNSIDTIDETAAVRMGVRNRLQTKRDALTFDWLELDTFFQVNIVQPDSSATFSNTGSRVSNLFNQLTFRPLPWVNLTIDSQLPVFNGRAGFTEVDSSLQFQATRDLDLTVSHRYLDNNPFFMNSSLLIFNAYYRFDDNWSAGFSERYEFAQHQLQAQSYTLYRDLSSFVASFGITVRNNNGVSDYGVLLNFTLKGVPKVNLPVGFDVNSVENQLTQQ